MATLDQAPPRGASIDNEAPSMLNSLLARVYTINWETVYYLVMFVAAIGSRFINLGDRVMSHDESLHTNYSYNLYTKGDFQHTPLMHGPILFHMVALSYVLFGDSDFSARLYPAILGVIMVFIPKLLFERWLGKFGAMAASLFVLISPMILFHNRYIREDTPAIFYTILMVFAIFAYIDGSRPRRPRFLVLLAGATVLNLGSKETAFMYILIFVAVTGLFLVLQMLQQWRRGTHTRIIGWTVLGAIVVPIAGLLGALAVAILNALQPETLTDISASGNASTFLNLNLTTFGNLLVTLLIGLPVAIGAIVGVFAFSYVIRQGLGRLIDLVLGEIGVRASSAFKLTMAGILIGAVVALLMTNVLSIIPPENIRAASATVAPVQGSTDPTSDALLARFVLWTGIILLATASVVIGTALVRFRKSPQLPWLDIFYVALISAAVAFVLLILEERSRLVPDVTKDTRPMNNLYIYGSWVICLLVIGGMAALRFFTKFWDEMQRYPAFDVLVVIGSLVLPWSAALPIFLSGYKLDQSSFSPFEISTMILGVIPFILVSVTAGLCWRPGLWMVCAATFYAIFAFFFTTVFTNPMGVATGLVGSLGYWLAQQGVRRGSQPQYYYMLVELPVYEYLVVIGAAIAGTVGMSSVWRFRAQQRKARAEEEQARLAAQMVYEGATDTPTYSDQAAENPETGEPTITGSSTLLMDRNNPDAVQPPEDESAPEPAVEEEPRFVDPIPVSERLIAPPFITFVGFWGVMILFALTLAGEKMPWLTTHIALPFCLLTGWYVGKVLESINWNGFFKDSWAVLLLLPIFIVGAVAFVGPLVFVNSPFGSLAREDQLRTFTWLGALLLTGIVGFALFRIFMSIGLSQMIKVSMLGVMVLLSILTARTAWMAAFINYDYPTEFLVYAHSAPQYKVVMSYLEDISRRMTDGMNIPVAYDEKVSWPGAWYFREFPKAAFLGNTSGASNLEQYMAILVGSDNAPKIESQLGDKFYRFDMNRLWWPMQEYFFLNIKRIDDAFNDAEMRYALWEIWWNRDYTAYTSAYARMTGNQTTKFQLDKWPVADRMVFYVRKDVAAQMWDFGTGTVKAATATPDDQFANLRCDICSGESVLGADAGGLASPRGVAIAPDGNIYVMDNQKARVVVFDRDGKFLRQFGSRSPVRPADQPGVAAPTGTFEDAWGIAVASDGSVIVADTWNHRIQVFDKNGTFIRSWGGTLERVEPGQKGTDFGFFGPRDVAVDAENHIYVADTGNKRIRVYDLMGTHLYDFGVSGHDLGQLNEPVGLAINNRTREIYVANTWNRRIEVYALDGTYQRTIAVPGWYGNNENGPDSFNRPYLAIDPTGNYLFVTDPDAGRVLVYQDRAPVLTFGRLASGSFGLSQFGVLGGIKFAPDGSLFLVDSGSGRVIRFNPNAFAGLRLNPSPTTAVSPAATDQPTEAATDKVF